MTKEKDPNEGLADDAVLATDLGDEDARRAEQQEYYGGDELNEDDTTDLSQLDRGDTIEDEDEDDGEKEGEEEESSEDSDESGESDSDSEEADEGEDDDGTPGETEEEEGDSESVEGEDEESESEEEEEEEEEEPEKKQKGIPRKRFNEVNRRMKSAEADLAQLRAEKTAKDDASVEKFDFDTAEDEYMALLLDGKTREAGDKRREIRAAEKEDFKAETKAEAVAEVDLSGIEKSLDSLSKEAERMFPIFDENSDDFNPAAVSKTLTFMKGYQADGMNADDAFVAALADMIDVYDLATESEDSGDEVTEDTEDPKPKKKVTKKKPIKKVKEKLKASKQQGKSPAGEGKGSSDAGAVAPSIDDMSDEDMDALPPDTLARIRGDYVD